MARLNGARLLMLEKEEDKVVRDIPVRTGPVQIGSNPTLNTIRLNSAGIEPIHCKIFVKNDKVFIANYSVANPISVNKTVVPKRAALHDGSILEICGTRFRWKFDDSKLAATGRPEKAKKAEQTPTSSKFGNRRRTTMVRKKQLAATAAAAAGGSGKKAAAKKVAQQKTPTYTLPKNHKQLLRNIRKRFTVHNIMTRQDSQDDADEDDGDCEESALAEVAESPKPATPQKSSSTTSSAANTPFYTPEPEKENSVPVTKTPKTPMLQLENSAMMILSYTPAIGSRSKANIQKTPISVAKSAQRLNYLTPKNENVSANATPLKSKAGNSMYLIDLTSPNSGHSSFVCSPMLDTTASSVGSPKLGLIDLTTPSPKHVKTPVSALKSTQQKTLLKSALKNASRTPRTALRTVTGTPATPKAVPKISLNDTPTKSAVSTRSNKTPASISKGSSIRSKLETPISSKKVDSARKQTAPATPTVAQSESTPQKEVPIMTTDELFDTLVGRQSNVKTYERKSTSPKKTPCPLVVAEDTSELPKTDIDLWVESVVAAVTSPEPVNMDAIIRKPNQTTQVRSSQYSDITPHESFAEAAGTSEVVDPQPDVVPVSNPDELDNITDKPTIPNSSRRSETPLASKIARSLGNKRQTIGNFFTNIFGKLTVSPVTRISIADDSLNQSEAQEQTNGDDSDGSEEVYHDSETTNHAGDVPQPTDESVASSPKLRQSLRDTRKFIGNAWTSLNTSRPQLDNTAEIDESLLLSDTYNETQTDAGNNTVDEDYDLTDLGSRPTTAQPPVSAAKTPTLRRSVQSVGAFDISPLATPLESTPNKTVPSQDLERDATGSFIISPDTNLLGTPVSRRSTPARKNATAATPTTSDSTPSRRSTRRQTIPQVDSNASLNESTVNSPAMQVEEAEKVEDIAEEQNCPETVPDQLEQSACNSSNKSMNDDVVNEQGDEQAETSQIMPQDATSASDLVVNKHGEENAVEELSQIDVIPETLDEVISAEGEMKTRDEEQPNAMAFSANSTALDTSEMEPLEVTEGHESESEVVQPATPPSKDLVGSKRATRNSIATFKVVTPKSASPAAKVPLSESKLPLRGLRRKTGELPEMPTGANSFQEVDLLEDSNKSMDPIENESVVEQSTEVEKSTASCDDQAQDKISTLNEVPPSEDHVSIALESSQVIVNPGVETVEDTTVHDSTANLETSNRNVTARRSSRKSLATMTTTPKTTTGPPSKVPMSESKLPLRRLQKTMAEAGEKSPEKSRGDVSVREVSDSSDVGKENKPIDPILEVGDDSVIEQSTEIDKSMTTCDDQVDIANVEAELNEITTHDEALQAEEDHVTSSLKLSQTAVDPDLESVKESAVDDSNLDTSNLNAVARRSTRKSLATATTTPQTAGAPHSKVPMSESKLPLRRLKATETSILEQTVEEAPTEENPSLDEKSIVVDSEQVSVMLEQSVEVGTPNTSTAMQSAKGTPIPASPGRPSRSSARSTPLKVSNTPSSKSTPSSTAPLLKRVLQKVVKASATKAAVVQSPKPDDSAAEASFQLDQLYRTPTPRVTRGKVTATSTPNVADESLKLDELYKTPARITRGNATPAGKVNDDESLASSSLHLDNLYGTPVRSVAPQEDSEIAVEDKLEFTSVDKSLDLHELCTTPAKALCDESQLSEVPATPKETVSPKVEADMSLNLQEMYKTPARVNVDQPAAKNADTPKETETSLNLEEMYKTPARSATSSEIISDESAVVGEPNGNEDRSLQHKTPAGAQQSHEVNLETPKAGDESLNLHQLYKTPTRSTRYSAAVKSTPKIVAEPQPSADMSFNLQELYKTPARPTLSAASSSTVKSTPKAVVVDQKEIEEPQPDVSLNLQELYKTPARPTRSAASSSTIKSSSKPIDRSKVEEPQPDVSFDLQELNKTSAKTPGANTQQPVVKNLETPNENVAQADASLNLQQLYKTPARPTRNAALASTSKSTPKAVVVGEQSEVDEPQPDVSLNLQELYKTPARPTRSAAASSTIKSTPKAVDLSKVEEPQPDMSLNLQELNKTTPARTLRANTTVTNMETPKEDVAQADVSLNLQQLYKTPACPTRSAALASTSKSTPKAVVVADQSEVDESQPDVSLNLQELYKTPARPTRSAASSSTIKSTPKAVVVDQGKVEEPQPDMQKLNKTPARTLRANTTVTNMETPKEDVAQLDESLNLQQLYKTPARPTRNAALASTSKSTPKAADLSKVDEPQPDMSLNLQELYKTPARTLRGVSQLTPAKTAKMSTPVVEPVQREPEADMSLNLDQLYKTPARQLRGTAQMSAVKHVKVSEVTPQKAVEKSATDVTPTAEISKVLRTPIATVSEPEANMTLNLEQMYKTPARQSSAEEKVEADATLNLDQLYKTPAHSLPGVTQLTSAQASTQPIEAKSEADTSLNLQEFYKTPARTQQGDNTQPSAAKESNQTPASSQQNMTVQADDSNLNVESLFKTPARTTRARLPRSSAKATTAATAMAKTPSRTPRSASKSSASTANPAANNSVKDLSMVESELASSNVVEESIDMGSESDGLATGKAISSTPFNPRIRKSTLAATVGMMSPLNSSGDVTMTFTSEMHTEAIGITTIQDKSTAADSTAADQMQTMAGVFVAAQSRLLYDETGSETTMLGDPLQVTNAVEPLADTQFEETTCVGEVTAANESAQPSAVESLLEQNDIVVKTPRSEKATIDVPETAEQSPVSAANASQDVGESVAELPEADANLSLEQSSSSPARALRSSRSIVGTPVNKSTVDNTSVIKAVEPEVNISPDLPETPARVPQSENSTTRNTPAAVVESKSPAVQSSIASPKGSVSLVVEPKSPAVQSPVASPKVLSTPASSAKKLTSGTPKSTPTRLSVANTTHESKPTSASKQRRSVTVNNSVNEQELAVVPDKVDETANEPVIGSPAVESKSTESVAEDSVFVAPADDTTQEKSITSFSVPESSAVEEKINDVTPEVVSTTEEPNVAAPYLDANDSLGVDTALLQQIRERVTSLERELEELDNVTHGSSTFLERSDDSQEVSEVEAKLEDKTPKPKKRQLYTKIAPDDSTPERRESIGDHRATSSKHVYVESASSDRKADTSSEADDSKKVEQPLKVLPSRASRRKITTLSEEALAGASPELKFVKPKPPKVVPTEDTPSINTSETEASDQETSLGRRKVAFNDHIQVKEINSPAFIGEIIKKTSLRGRGRNTNQVVTVTVDQNLGQSIKPATKRGKPVEVQEVSAQDAENVTVEATEDVSGKVEHVEAEQKPSRAGKSKTTSKKNASAVEPVASNDEVVAEDAKNPEAQSEETVEMPVDEPATKRGRAKKVPAAKRTASKTKVEEQTSANEDKTDELEAAAVKPAAKRSRRGAKTDAEVIEAVKEATDADANVEVEHKTDEPVADEEIVEDANEPSGQSEGIVEESIDEPAAKRSRAKKAPAAKRAASRTKIEEQTATNEDKADEPEPVIKQASKRSRRGANVDVSDVTETVAKKAEEAEKPAEVVQTVDEPVSKRIRHAPEAKPEQAVEKSVDSNEDQTNEPAQTKEVQPATKAPSRSRRGKKQATETPIETEAESETAPVQAPEVEQASKSKEVKPRSRRGGKKNETPTEEVVHTESTDDAPAEVKEPTDNTTEPLEKKTDDNKPKSRRDTKKKPVETKAASAEDDGSAENATIESQEPSQTEKTHEVSEPKEETKSRSRRGGAKGKTTDKKAPADEVENVPAETQNEEDAKQPESRRAAKKKITEDESIAKESEEVSSSADSHVEKSSSQSQPATRKTNRRGRGTPKNDTVESGDHPESSAATSASLVVEKAVADSTSSDDPSTAEVDAKSNMKRSRRGAKDESELTEAKDEPTTKRTRRAPKSKTEQISEEVPAETAESVEVNEEPKATGRSRRGKKQESVLVTETESSATVEKPATKRTKQTAKKVEVEVSQQESTVEQQEASKAEQSDVEEKPASRRGAKKKTADEQLNAKMPSPTLPPPAVEEQPVKRVGRQAAKRAPKKASNPDPAPVEMSMNESHMVKTMLPASHTSTPLTKTAANADVEVPSATRGRRAANPVIAALIEESTPSTRTRRGASATPKEQVETPSTPARRGRGRGAAAKAKTAEDETAKEDKEVVADEVQPEVVEAEPVTKRARKAPAKLRDEADDDLGAKKAQPTRGRRGAKAKTEESNADADDETAEVSAGPSEEPKKKGRATAKRTVKKADLNEESVPEEEEEKTPKSPPPKRTRKGAK